MSRLELEICVASTQKVWNVGGEEKRSEDKPRSRAAFRGQKRNEIKIWPR